MNNIIRKPKDYTEEYNKIMEEEDKNYKKNNKPTNKLKQIYEQANKKILK